MDRLYRFSPITNEEGLLEAIQYVVTKTTELCHKVIGVEYPISGLTVCAHYPDEFEALKKIQLEIGTVESEHNGLYIRLREPIQLPHNKLNLLRVRMPDPYRMQVGCNDFNVGNYMEFKETFLPTHPQNLRLVVRPEYEMIEFFDPDYDVLAYTVSDPALG